MKHNQVLALVIDRLAAFDRKLKSGLSSVKDQLAGVDEEIIALKSSPMVGEKGEKGDPGARGDKGEAGAVGAKGEKGDRGPQGERGPEGQRGTQGIQGEKGDKGDKGERGEQGLEGQRGPVGMRGPAGRDGKDGIDGKDGEVPSHQVKDGRIRFSRSDGSWGKWIQLRAVNNYYSGSGVAQKTWIDYAIGFSEEPVLLGVYDSEEVYEYTYSDETLYRVIGDPVDAFYSSFNDGQASGLVAQKAI